MEPTEFSELSGQGGPVIVLGLLSLIVYSQIHRYRHVYGQVEREQVKWFLFAILVILSEVILLASARVFGFQPSAVVQDLFGLLLLVLPLSVGFAVLRYRLYDIDLIINRTMVYVPLTAIVAGLIAAGVKLSQAAFVALTGNESDAALVAITFIVVSLSTPIRNRLQAFADQYFKESADAERRLRPFTERVSEVLEVLEPARIGRRFVEESVAAVGADGGALYRVRGSRRNLVFKSDGWHELPQLEVAIPDKGGSCGVLFLGKRKSGAPYSIGDRQAVEALARVVAPALAWKKPIVAAGHRERRLGKAGRRAHAHQETAGGGRR
jgi:hypothetical protein